METIEFTNFWPLIPFALLITGGFFLFSRSKKAPSTDVFLQMILEQLPLVAGIYNHKNEFVIGNEDFLSWRKEIGDLGILHNLNKALNSKDLISDEFVLDGKKYSFYIKAKKLEHNGENFFLFTALDISFLKEKEQIIEFQQTQLYEASKLSAMGEMAGGFAHEINNPLTVICGNNTRLETLLRKKDALDESVQGILNKNNQMVFRITKIISGLRKLTRNQTMEISEFIFDELFEEIVELTHFRTNSCGIEVEIHNESKGELVHSDRVLLGQILINLINNSVDAIEETKAPKIILSAFVGQGKLKVLVQDNGPGIPKEVAEKIFLPMFTTKEVGRGTGLGLSLSQNIAKHLGGSITYRGNIAGLTTFEVSVDAQSSNKNVA